MKLTACITSHFISAIEDGMVKKVHNRNSNGRPIIKLKNLKDIYQAANNMLQNENGALNEPTLHPFADRKTKARNGDNFEEDQQPESSSNEDISDDITLSQLKKPKNKKRKASESVVTPKTELDDSDLNEPLFKFKVKASKTSPKKKLTNESFPATAAVKVEAHEVDYSECIERVYTDDVSLVSDESATFIASESGVIFVKDELKSEKSESFLNEGEICGLNEESLDNLVLDNEENMSNDSLVESTSDCSQSQPTFEQVNHISDVQDSVDADVDMNSLNSDTILVDTEDTPTIQEQQSFIPDNDDSKVNFSETDTKNEESDCIKLHHTERLPSTRKAISPTSQEKLCLAMKSEELLDDMDQFKCKEKLSFDEQPPDNKLSDTVYSEPNVQLQKEKSVITTKTMVKKTKSFKKGSPTKKCQLDGPRLCRSLPRLSTGCTTVEGCSESAIAFSQRQMHDIESLASKLMSELNSMKVIVEEKLLFEAYRSTSLKNEADEVKSAIKSATKTEETAKKWLSMMSRDCSRFCKIMKLAEDPEMVQEKAPVERVSKKISFADEAGGTLCDIKIYEKNQTSLELNQNQES